MEIICLWPFMIPEDLSLSMYHICDMRLVSIKLFSQNNIKVVLKEDEETSEKIEVE